MLRLGAIAIVLVPVVAGVLLRDLSWGVWLGVGVAAAGGVGFAVARPRARSLVVLGTLLAVLAGFVARELPVELGEPTQVDLRSEEAPSGLRGSVMVTGYFREEWTMAEFAVAEGALPQQDAPAEAVLVPLLGVEDDAVLLRGAVVVARVRPGQEEASGVQTVYGRARALEPEILSVLLQASRVQVPSGVEVEGVLVDAVEVEQQTPGWLRWGLVGLAMVGALVSLWIAGRRDGGGGGGGGEDGGSGRA